MGRGSKAGIVAEVLGYQGWYNRERSNQYSAARDFGRVSWATMETVALFRSVPAEIKTHAIIACSPAKPAIAGRAGAKMVDRG